MPRSGIEPTLYHIAVKAGFYSDAVECRTLSPVDRVLSLVGNFHNYLYGTKFKVMTDNNPLTYVLTSAKLDATGQR